MIKISNSQFKSVALPLFMCMCTTYLVSEYGHLSLFPSRLQLEMGLLTMLMPGLAFWLLLKRKCPIFILFWLAVPAILFGLPQIPFWIFWLAVCRTGDIPRKVGLVCIGIVAMGSTLMFVFSQFWFMAYLWQGYPYGETVEQKKLGPYEIHSYAYNDTGAAGGCRLEVTAERHLGPHLALVTVLDSQYEGSYDHLEVIEPRTVRFRAVERSGPMFIIERTLK